MKVLLNGEAHTAPDGLTVAALLEQLQLAGKRIAVEVNEEIIPRSQHGNTVLRDGDRIEIVHAIGGG